MVSFDLTSSGAPKARCLFVLGNVAKVWLVFAQTRSEAVEHSERVEFCKRRPTRQIAELFGITSHGSDLRNSVVRSV